MLSKIPINLEKLKTEDLNKEILRAAIIAELDAVNLYEQMAALTEDGHIKTILLDIAREEKAHVGEFQALLLINDKQQERPFLLINFPGFSFIIVFLQFFFFFFEKLCNTICQTACVGLIFDLLNRCQGKFLVLRMLSSD